MSSQFDNISAKQIMTFCTCVGEISSREIDFLQETYTRKATNFLDTINFFEALGLLTITGKDMQLSNDFRQLLDDIRKCAENVWDEIIRQFFIKILLNKQNSLSRHVIEFLDYFDFEEGEYRYRPKTTERLHYSSLRNLLIGLEFIYLNSQSDTYIISDDYFHYYSELRQDNPISIDELYRIMYNREEIGRAAEEEILKYERERLSNHPNLCEKIEHVGQVDVGAGYDIKSFEDILDVSGQPN